MYLRQYKADGTVFWNHVFVAALRNSEHKIINYVGIQHPLDKVSVLSLLTPSTPGKCLAFEHEIHYVGTYIEYPKYVCERLPLLFELLPVVAAICTYVCMPPVRRPAPDCCRGLFRMIAPQMQVVLVVVDFVRDTAPFFLASGCPVIAGTHPGRRRRVEH